MSNTWTTKVEEDENGNMVLPFDPTMLAQMDWREADVLDFQMGPDDSCTIHNLSWEDRQKMHHSG